MSGSWKEDEAILRARWDVLQNERAAIMDKVMPLREVRDKLVQESDAKIKALDAQIKDASGTLYDIENERARIARQLGAKSLRVR